LQKFLPNVPSPLLYNGLIYLIKDGGILTAVDAKTGKLRKQGRLAGALDTYYSSPVAGAGMVYLISKGGKVSVVKAGSEWEVLAVNDLEEEVYATPAIVDSRIYLRTTGALYCFSVDGK
jgi:outer membrane protein assembly factor BamB